MQVRNLEEENITKTQQMHNDNVQVKINHLIQSLRYTITKHLKVQDALRSNILKEALSYIDKVNINLNNDDEMNAKLLDLYITVNSIFTICIKYQNDLPAELRTFFASREDFLRGDSHDYCYQPTLANQFCQTVAKLVFANEAPLNVLLHKALTENRSAAWRDETTLEENLDSPLIFFRTNDNCIHVYEAIVDRAIANLKRGNYNLSTVWFGTDSKNLNALTPEDLNVLKQRSISLNHLIEYTEQLTLAVSDVHKRFVNLASGLRAGKALRYAKSPSYFAVQQFFDWWNNLTNSVEGVRIKSIITEDKNLSSLAEYIEKLKTTKDDCVDGLGHILQKILNSEDVRKTLHALGHNPMQLLSNGELDQARIRVIKDLQHFQLIKTKTNVFSELSRSEQFLEALTENKNMNFNDLAASVATLRERITPNPALSVVDVPAVEVKDNVHPTVVNSNNNFALPARKKISIFSFHQNQSSSGMLPHDFGYPSVNVPSSDVPQQRGHIAYNYNLPQEKPRKMGKVHSFFNKIKQHNTQHSAQDLSQKPHRGHGALPFPGL